jgi:hypothetical protein
MEKKVDGTHKDGKEGRWKAKPGKEIAKRVGYRPGGDGQTDRAPTTERRTCIIYDSNEAIACTRSATRHFPSSSSTCVDDDENAQRPGI